MAVRCAYWTEDIVAPTSQFTLGFLTVLQEASGFLGGYLVTNTWGRPLEFRLTSAVQPARLHQVLYAGTLRTYICADLIGKALVEKTGVAVQLIVTDIEAVLEMRPRIEVPVLWVAQPDDALAREQGSGAHCVVAARPGRGPVLTHPGFAQEVPRIRELLAPLDGLVDLAEPFGRIREAIAEARKMGVANRAA